MSDSKKISYNSPLGKALIGKEIGDEVTVKAPKGDLMYEVQNIKYNWINLAITTWINL